jgi:hypothetical protein
LNPELNAPLTIENARHKGAFPVNRFLRIEPPR